MNLHKRYINILCTNLFLQIFHKFYIISNKSLKVLVKICFLPSICKSFQGLEMMSHHYFNISEKLSCQPFPQAADKYNNDLKGNRFYIYARGV